MNRNDEREIGPLGTGARVAGGIAAIVLPTLIGGLVWWDVAAALVALPLVAIAASALLRWSRVPLAATGVQWGRTIVLLALVIAAEIGLTFVTALDGATALWLFLGLSSLVAAVRDEAGCEVLAIPNLLAGRADRVGCPVYTPFDAVDAAERERA